MWPQVFPLLRPASSSAPALVAAMAGEPVSNDLIPLSRLYATDSYHVEMPVAIVKSSTPAPPPHTLSVESRREQSPQASGALWSDGSGRAPDRAAAPLGSVEHTKSAPHDPLALCSSLEMGMHGRRGSESASGSGAHNRTLAELATLGQRMKSNSAGAPAA